MRLNVFHNKIAQTIPLTMRTFNLISRELSSAFTYTALGYLLYTFVFKFKNHQVGASSSVTHLVVTVSGLVLAQLCYESIACSAFFRWKYRRNEKRYSILRSRTHLLSNNARGFSFQRNNEIFHLLNNLNVILNSGKISMH